MKPLVSVIIATYNNADTIQEALASVLDQDYPNLEIIVVNDNSTDITGKLLDKMEGLYSRIKVIHNSRNMGVAKSRNLASDLASGKYLAPQDGDDVWIRKDRISKQIDFLENNHDYVL